MTELEAIEIVTAFVEDEDVRDHPQYMGPTKSNALDALSVIRTQWAVRNEHPRRPPGRSSRVQAQIDELREHDLI